MANSIDVSKRSKHMDVNYHYIRQEAQNRPIFTEYCSTDIMFADIFTKPLARNRYVKLCDTLDVRK